MQLDFTGIDSIAAAAEFTADPPEPDTKILQRSADQRGQEIQQAAIVYKRYQENIRKTELLQSQILNGIREQRDVYYLLLLEAKALSLTISNREFYAQILKELPQYYPDALDAASAAPEA